MPPPTTPLAVTTRSHSRRNAAATPSQSVHGTPSTQQSSLSHDDAEANSSPTPRPNTLQTSLQTIPERSQVASEADSSRQSSVDRRTECLPNDNNHVLNGLQSSCTPVAEQSDTNQAASETDGTDNDESEEDEDAFEMGLELNLGNYEQTRIEEERQARDVPPDIHVLPPVTNLNPKSSNWSDTLYLEICETLPEYPATDPLGYTYIIPVPDTNGRPHPRDLGMQYCHRIAHPPNDGRLTIFGNAKGKRWSYVCSGVRCCEQIDKALVSRDIDHTQLTEEQLKALSAITIRCNTNTDSIAQKKAKAWVICLLQDFERGKFCSGSSSDRCAPLLNTDNHPTITAERPASIQCNERSNASLSSSERKKHFYKAIRTSSNFDGKTAVEYFGKLLEQQTQQLADPTRATEPVYGGAGNLLGTRLENDPCASITNQMGRMKKCPHNHLSGVSPTWRHHACKVHFSVFIPDDLETWPHIAFTSHGKHVHPPPPPTKTPAQVILEIQAVLDRAKEPGLTAAKLVVSYAMRDYLKEKGLKTLGDIHPSLNNMDTIRLLLEKRRLLWYPEKTAMDSVIWEYRQRHMNTPDEAYIQAIHKDYLGLQIFCITKEQAHMWLDWKSWQVDMSFKRCKQRNLNEIIFASYLEELGKITTFARVYMEGKDNKAYTMMFKRLFELVEKLTKRRVRFRYIDGEDSGGWEAITADMDQGQFKGMDRLLKLLWDQRSGREAQTWQWHVANMFIFCRIHFKRGVDRIAGRQRWAGSAHERLESILDAESESDYISICRRNYVLAKTKAEQEWILHKAGWPIRAGLNAACSKILPSIRKQVLHNNNAVEQTGWKGNATGIRANILECILRAETINRRDVSQFNARIGKEILHIQQNPSLEQRFTTIQRREIAARKQRLLEEAADNSDQGMDDYADTLFEMREQDINSLQRRSSSSGTFRQPAKKRRRSQAGRGPTRRQILSSPLSQITEMDSESNTNMSVEADDEDAKLLETRKALDRRRKALELARQELALAAEEAAFQQEKNELQLRSDAAKRRQEDEDEENHRLANGIWPADAEERRRVGIVEWAQDTGAENTIADK